MQRTVNKTFKNGTEFPLLLLFIMQLQTFKNGTDSHHCCYLSCNCTEIRFEKLLKKPKFSWSRMFQVRIRAFVDHQPGTIIPVESIGDILNPNQRCSESSPTSEDAAKLKQIYEVLEPLAPVFLRREEKFTKQVGVEKSSPRPPELVLVTVTKFLDDNRMALSELISQSNEQLSNLTLNSLVHALYEKAVFSSSTYSAFLKACLTTQVFAKEKNLQVRLWCQF